MNTNDLPPAARLAVLIEAGAVANPHLHLDGRGYYDPKFDKRACALCFATLGNGAAPNSYEDVVGGIDKLGISLELKGAVECMAMGHGMTIREICRSLREGELAKVPA